MWRKKEWNWTLKDADGAHNGSVLAIDPRDALSRMLTSDKGMELAMKNGITPDILHFAPGNADTTLKLEENGVQIYLEQQQGGQHE